ncbi:MAG TPA: RsmG family class I SAM-dependent methyltransferase [Thermoanaerobaculia bacterium]|nr:RsmG family class I SAM-dependent methyltransferase [Thermoanaerobaculia bacterium]
MSGAALEAAVDRAVATLPERARPMAESAREGLAGFLAFLLERNAAMNLVSARAAEPEALAGHLGDALAGLPLLPPSRPARIRLLDLGSGGGFPALPILLLRRDLAGTLVESTRKKCDFLAAAAERLALTAEVVNARFPDSFPMAKSGLFDVLTTRAVGSAGKLVRAARPVLAPGARALLWTTEPLVRNAVRDSGAKSAAFHRDPGSERRGILALERFT